MSYISLSMFQRFCDGLAKVVNKKLDATGVANNDTTTAEGYVADARIVKTHGDEIDALAKKNNGLFFDTNSDGKWGYKTSQTGTLIPFRNPTGNATAADVLSGKTFSSAAEEDATGTMPNRGELNVTLKPDGNNATSQSVAAGYYSGGTIKADGTSSYSSGYTNGQSAGVNSGKETMRIKEYAIVWVSFEYHSEIHIYRDGQEVASHNLSAQGNYLRGSLGGGSVNITALRSGTYYVNGSYIYANAGQTIASLSHAEDRGYSLACAACAL